MRSDWTERPVLKNFEMQSLWMSTTARPGDCPMCGYGARLFADKIRADGESHVRYRVSCPNGHELAEIVYEAHSPRLMVGRGQDVEAACAAYETLAAAYDGPKRAGENDWRIILGDDQPSACPVCGQEPWHRGGVLFGCPDHRWLDVHAGDECHQIKEWNRHADLLERLQSEGLCERCGRTVRFDIAPENGLIQAFCLCVTVSSDDVFGASRAWLTRIAPCGVAQNNPPDCWPTSTPGGMGANRRIQSSPGCGRPASTWSSRNGYSPHCATYGLIGTNF